METLISEQCEKILIGVKETFVYFDSSSINYESQLVIDKLLNIVENKTSDNEIDISKLLEKVEDFNTSIQSGIEDILMRSKALYCAEQTLEKEAVCCLFKARMNTLKMMLLARK